MKLAHKQEKGKHSLKEIIRQLVSWLNLKLVRTKTLALRQAQDDSFVVMQEKDKIIKTMVSNEFIKGH